VCDQRLERQNETINAMPNNQRPGRQSVIKSLGERKRRAQERRGNRTIIITIEEKRGGGKQMSVIEERSPRAKEEPYKRPNQELKNQQTDETHTVPQARVLQPVS